MARAVSETGGSTEFRNPLGQMFECVQDRFAPMRKQTHALSCIAE